MLLRQKIAIHFPYSYSFLIGVMRKVLKYLQFSKCSYMKKDYQIEYNKKHITLSLNKPYIFFALYWFKPSGAEYYALECAKLAKENGFNIIWIVEFPSDNDDWVNQFLSISENVYYVYQLKEKNDKFSWLIKLIDVWSPIALHIHHSNFCYYFLKQFKERYPSIVTIDSTHIIELKDEGFPYISRCNFQYLDYRNVISLGLEEYFMQHSIEKNSIIRSVIIPDYEPRKKLSNVTIQNEINIKFIGRLDEQKRPYLILPLVQEVRRLLEKEILKTDLKINFLIYGSGEYSETLESRLPKHMDNNINIEIVKNCYDKNKIYENTFCVVQLSENEGISLVSFESIINNIYIFTTNVGQQNEVIEKEFLLPSNARQAVKVAATRIIELIHDYKKFEDVFEVQRQNIWKLNEKFGYKQIMSDFYAQLIEGKK